MDAETKYIKQLTTVFLGRGAQLLQRLSKTKTLDSQLPSDIAEWIKESTNQILPLMPEELSDYNTLVEIQNHYIKNPSILHLSAKEDIRIVLHHLQMAGNCILAAFRTDAKDIPPQNLANVAHLGLKCTLENLASIEFIEKLKGKEDGITSRTAMLNIYGKICMWTMSMVSMNRPQDLLALAGSVRAVLELYIDLNLFLIEAIPKGAEKYFSFPKIEKWRVAKNLLSIQNQLNSSVPKVATYLDAYLNDPANSKTNIEALRSNLWGTDKNGKVVMPKNWPNMDLKQRIDEVGDKELSEICIESYYYCNWMVHSMYNDLLNNLDNVCLFAWHLFELSTKMFLLATQLINKTIEVIPEEDVELLIKKVDRKKLKYLFGELVKASHNQSNSS